MFPSSVFDPQSAAIVLGGTFLACVLRCGFRSVWAAVKAVAGLRRKSFDQDGVRHDLALQIQAIDKDGLLRAELQPVADPAFAASAAALIRTRSVQALFDEHHQHQKRRADTSERAVSVLTSMGELGPVLGLVGTLVALSSLSSGGMAIADYGTAIGTAVTTTLYGLLLANFIAFPLCARVERRAAAEEQAREEVLHWLADSVRNAAPHTLAPPTLVPHADTAKRKAKDTAAKDLARFGNVAAFAALDPKEAWDRHDTAPQRAPSAPALHAVYSSEREKGAA